MKRPTKRNQNSLYNLIDTSESLLQSESQWICQSDDLLALARDADYGWFSASLENAFLKASKTLTKVRTRKSFFVWADRFSLSMAPMYLALVR